MDRSWTSAAGVHLKSTNKSYWLDETYIRIKGQDRYLYRAVDSRLYAALLNLGCVRESAG
jgi:transposase-like protein